MSAEDLETIRRGVAAYNAGDVEGMIALCDPEVRLTPMRKLLEGGEYFGHAGLRRFMADMDEDWSERGIDVSEVRDAGDSLLVLGDFHGVGRASAAEVRYPVAWRCDVHDGKLARMVAYSDQEQALADVGLTA
jgi:ketosteroid isomerase-like protein